MSRRQRRSNSYTEEDEDGENSQLEDVLISSATVTDPRFIVPDHAQGSEITRKFVIQFDNSLASLASRPSQAKWTPNNGCYDIFQSKSRYAPNCARSEKRRGNLEQVILIGMKIKKIDSTFPCQLGLNVFGCRGNYYLGNGEQYAFLISPNEKSHNMDEIICVTNPLVNSEYLSRFPGMSSKTLKTEGIMRVPGEDFVYVDKMHPLIDMIKENSDLLQIDLDEASLLENRWYKIEETVANRCLEDLERELILNLPLFNLTEFFATIARPYNVDFDDTREICDNLASNRDLKNRVLNVENHLTVVLEISYFFM